MTARGDAREALAKALAGDDIYLPDEDADRFLDVLTPFLPALAWELCPDEMVPAGVAAGQLMLGGWRTEGERQVSLYERRENTDG